MSGGERQRVAMGRALVRKPAVFLFDEPLSNLDASLRAGIRADIGSLVRRLDATALYVTHDHVEAMTLADTIVVMRAGRVLQQASPRAIYERPANAFVATFVGSPRMNMLTATRAGDALVAGDFRFAAPPVAPAEVQVGFRCEHVELVDGGAGDGVPGEVSLAEPLGAETHLTIATKAGPIVARFAGFDGPRAGESVRVRVSPERCHFFQPGVDGARLGEPGI